MKVNVVLLRKVRKLIKEEPRRLNMRVWGITGVKGPNAPPCGTKACLAGWTLLAATPKKKWSNLFGFDSFFNPDIEVNITERAAGLLGIPEDSCPFFSYGWQARHVIKWIDQQIQAAKSKGGN